MLSNQEKIQLFQKINSNKHEIYLISFEEMELILQSTSQGSMQEVQDAWREIKGKVGLGASYYASADDAVTMTKLIGDLGGIGARAYIKNYGGRPHIILKGHAGLRKILTGTRYGVKHPKVITMGLGKAGSVAAAKQGGILTVILLSTYRVVDYFLTDQATLSQLIGTLATDVVKVGIATASSIGAAIVMGGFTLAVGPILAVVVVGIGTSILLEYSDNNLGITKRVIAGLDELSDSTESYIAEQKRKALNTADRVVYHIIDQAIDSAQRVAIKWVRQALREYLSPSRRVW